MKILRIKLTNLNSLRGDYEVDFEAEPLANAGLFAITGPTGAGKSTLLDAITLALYGRAARYANTSSPDDMMSRHCGECRAEVEFSVPRGRFRAAWHLRRARGKADGKMQASARYLYDAGGNVLAEKIRDVEVQIEQLIGLDYDRFLRSVLLAQGEFARFLRANPNERAELLESLTGTAIYSELSMLAHSEAVRRENELQMKEGLLNQVVLLTGEQCQEREQQIVAQEKRLQVQKNEVNRLNKEIGQARQFSAEISKQKELQTRSGLLEIRKKDSANELLRLAKHRLTLPYANDLNGLDAARTTADEDGRRLQVAGKARQESHRRWIAGIVAACEFANKEIAKEGQSLARLQVSLKEHEQQKQETETWLNQHTRDKELESQLPEIVAQLGNLESLRRDCLKVRSKLSTLEAESQAQLKAVQGAEKLRAEAEQLLKTKETERTVTIKALEASLGGVATVAREAELTRCRSQAQVVGALVGLEESCERQRKKIEEDQLSLKNLGDQLVQVQVAAKAAASRKDDARKALALQQDHLHKAKLVANLEEHRSRLKPGEPCPLCGALEHPYAGGNDTGLATEAIQAEVQKAETVLASAEEQAKTADNLSTTLQVKQSELAKSIERTRGELSLDEKRMSELASQHALESRAQKTWAQAKFEFDKQTGKLERELLEIKNAEKAVQDCETARIRTEAALSKAIQGKEHQEKLLLNLQGQLAEQKSFLGDYSSKTTKAEVSLQQVLEIFGIAVPGPSQEQEVRKTLQIRNTGFRDKTENLGRLSVKVRETGFAIESAQKSLSILKQRSTPFAAARAAHDADAAAVSAAPVQQLKTRWTTLEEAENHLRTLESETSNAAAKVDACKSQCEHSTNTAKRLNEALGKLLENSAFESIESLRAARLSLEQASRLEQLEQNLKSETDQLKGRLEEVQKAIDAFQAAKVPEGEAVNSLESNLRTAQNGIEELIAQIAKTRDELQRDQEARLNHAAKAAEVEQERKRLQVWKQLQAVIGSYDGAKFRRYAQGISLDILIYRANLHLQRLSDRYRTRRREGEELELEIEDLYQAGVKRPMASLSGGESFLASLALALGLADLAGRNVRIECLFIDEGFGSLDTDTLDLAISALESLRQNSKTVGVISHVELLKERIATQIIVEKQSGGMSRLRVAG